MTCCWTKWKTSCRGNAVMNPSWERSEVEFNDLRLPKCVRLRRPTSWNQRQAQQGSIAHLNLTVARLEAMAPTSSHLAFRSMSANQPSTMPPSFVLLWCDTSGIPPRPLDGSTQHVGLSKQCYRSQTMQYSGPFSISQWVRPSNGRPVALGWMLSIFRPIPWIWSNTNGRNWLLRRENMSKS